MKNLIRDAVGGTPLVQLSNITKGLNRSIYLKLEYMNPWMSIKDRVALNIIETAEREGKIHKDTHIIEATSGNTGISLAGICAARGYAITIVMPEFVSYERKLLLRMLGANIVLTPAEQGLLGPVAKSFELAKEFPLAFIADQTRNPANPEAHFATGQEIFEQLNGEVDVFVAASGTGGHITGVGTYLKSVKPDIQIAAVEPRQAAVLSGQVELGAADGNHGVIGIGPGFIPETLNREIIDDVIVIDPQCAYDATKRVIAQEGLLIGVSTGAAIHAALEIVYPAEKHINIVVIAASSTERYLSTHLADDARQYIETLVASPASSEGIEKLLNKA